MKFRALLSALLLVAGLVFVAAGSEPAAQPTDSPSEVLKKSFAALQKQDFLAMADLSYGEQRTECLRVVEELNRLKKAAESGDEKAKNELVLAQQMLNDVKVGMSKVKVEIKEEKIEGDLAEVDAAVSGTSDKKVEVKKAYLKKINGKWKIISLKDFEAEKAKTVKK